MKTVLIALFCVLAAACVVLPSLHIAFRPPLQAYISSTAAPSPPLMVRELVRQELADWDAGRRDIVRDVNPEWDLGHHTFFALGLANLAESAAPADRETYRVTIDAVLDELRRRPPEHFHLPYFHGTFRDAGARSLFLEGEILFVLAARLEEWPDPSRHAELEERARRVVGMMRRAPLAMAESYPDECWMFDNTLALAALAVTKDVLGRRVEGAEEVARRWRAHAKDLTDPHTGLLFASTTWNGQVLDGPEASSAFGVAHFLELVDPSLARDQYERAKHEFVVRPLGFAYAKEWPDPSKWGRDRLPPRAGMADVDSGPVIPFVHAGAGGSGMAILGAAAFRDNELLGELTTSLELAAFPERRQGTLRFLASNGLGDAVLLYALAQGPLFRRVREGMVKS
jgi:hypothetical protein